MPEKFGFEDGEENDENEWLEDYFANHPEAREAREAREFVHESGPEVEQFEKLIATFESEHSLSELNSIIELTPEDAPNHPIREPARLSLIPIVELLKTLENETNVSPEKLADLKARYRVLSRAVGIINGGKVDHTR
jgi:hypothetical protein